MLPSLAGVRHKFIAGEGKLVSHRLSGSKETVLSPFSSSPPVKAGWRQDLPQPGSPPCLHSFGSQACVKYPS